MSEALTEDGFLGGRLTVLQPAKGYRAGMDPVLLAAAVPARAGETALDLGCGVGVAGLCLAARVADVAVCGLEVQENIADLARRNAAANRLALEVVAGDLAAMPAALRARRFDHVLTNPPYFRRAAGTPSAGSRELAMGETVPLAAWVDAGLRRVVPGGTLTVIQAAERLPDLLAACGNRLGDVRVLPLVSRAGRPADRILLRGRKGRRGPFRLLSPLVLHFGARHEADADSYSPDVSAILRDGAALQADWC